MQSTLRAALVAIPALFLLWACLPRLGGKGGAGDPLRGLSEKERKAARAHAMNLCVAAGKADPSDADTSAALSDLAAGFMDRDRGPQIVEAGTALARHRGCVAAEPPLPPVEP